MNKHKKTSVKACTVCATLNQHVDNWILTETISQRIEQVINDHLNKRDLVLIETNGLEKTYQCKNCQTRWYFKLSDGPNRGHFSR